MQPEHCDSSTLTTGASAVPPRRNAGQASSARHFKASSPCVATSATCGRFCFSVRRANSIQGSSAMMTRTPERAFISSIVFSVPRMLKGLTLATSVTPMPRTTLSMSRWLQPSPRTEVHTPGLG